MKLSLNNHQIPQCDFIFGEGEHGELKKFLSSATVSVCKCFEV